MKPPATVPTGRAVALALGAGVLALAAVFDRRLGPAVAAVDGALLVAIFFDAWRAPPLARLAVQREVGAVLSAGTRQRVTLRLSRLGNGVLHGELRDEVPLGMGVEGHRQSFRLEPAHASLELTYDVWPEGRGDFAFGRTHVRLLGPWQLASRQGRLGASSRVKSYPNLHFLRGDPGLAGRSQEDAARRLRRRGGEGREFESLREYRPGDDPRSLDWKATARRGDLTVRLHRPEQNQTVLLCLDCGRHMAGNVLGRAKLDFAVDAALRLASASLGQGDRVGLVAFGAHVRAAVPAAKGKSQLSRLCRALYRLEASLEESNYAAGFEAALRQTRTRALVVVLTDLLDAAAAETLIARTRKLQPRHLSLVVSLLDEEVQRAARAIPETAREAFRRSAAGTMEAEGRATVARLVQAGALVVRTAPRSLGPAALRQYLDIKARGRL